MSSERSDTTNEPNDGTNHQASQLKSVNRSGYPLQIAIAHVVEAGRHVHGWRVLYEEHAWIRDERRGFIDVVLEQDELQVVLLIECKRLQDTEWIFLPPDGNAKPRRRARARRVDRENGIAKYPVWSDEPLNPATPEAMFCVTPKESGGLTVDNVSAELVAATEALEREECKYLDRRGGDSRRLYFAAIVTTAKLSICSFDPRNISLANGKIPDDAKFSPAGVVRYTKQLSAGPVDGTPRANYGEEADALVKAKERTVFIVNAEHLDKFLDDFDVDDRKRS